MTKAHIQNIQLNNNNNNRKRVAAREYTREVSDNAYRQQLSDIYVYYYYSASV